MFRLASVSSRLFWGVFAVGAIFLAYLPGLDGPFMFDDMPNIVDNVAFSEDKSLWDIAFSIRSGPLYRPIAMMSFGVNHALSGFDPWIFKLTNVIIHICCALAVFFFTSQLMHALSVRYMSLAWLDNKKISIAFWVALLWGLHPINLTTVLYVVQRMTSLSCLFMVLGLGLYCLGRNRIIQGKNGWWFILSSAFIAFPLAVLSKENSLVWPVLVLFIECLVFEFQSPKPLEKKLFTYFSFLGGLILVGIILWLMFNVSWLERGYIHRDFDLYQRILTQLRILWAYVYWIMVPFYGSYGLYHDDILISQSIGQPWLTWVAALGWMTCLAVAGLSYKRHPWFALSVGFFLICHMLESSVFGLELVHEHRNYIACLGLLVPAAAGLVWLQQKNKTLMYLCTILLAGLLFSTTAYRAYQWATWPRLVWTHVVNQPQSPRANYEAGLWYFNAILNNEDSNNDKNIAEAQKYFDRVTLYDGNEITGLIGNIRLKDLQGEVLSLNDDEVRQLLNRLENSAIGESKGTHLINWFSCHQKGECRIDSEVARNILWVALQNPRAANRVKGRLAHLQGIILYHQKNALAIDYFTAAISFDGGEGEYWVSLIHTLIEMGAIKEARQAYSDFATTKPELFKQFSHRFTRHAKILNGE